LGFNSGTHCSQLTMPTTLDATSLSTRIFAAVIVEEIDITERHSSSHKDRDASDELTDDLPQTLLSSNNLLVSAAVQRSTSLLRHCADGATQFLFKKAENSEEFNETRL
jgi:hypothetical protein